jgi:hypothetical protein
MFRITRRKLNITFWTVFILSGAVLISGLITNIIFLDILLSTIVIAIGFHGLLEEITARENRKAFRKLDDSLQQLSEWFQKSHLFIKSIKEKHELRLHHLDTKRAQTEQKLEKKSRELTKRMIEIENKFNTLKKSLSEKYKPLTKPERRYARAIKILRKEGLITASIYSRRMAISTSIAGKDLTKMASIGIIKKRGKGRNVYYILAI